MMSRKRFEIQVIMHWPQTETGWKILIGRMAIFSKLMNDQKHGKIFNMDACIRQITQEDALEAYAQSLEETQDMGRRRRNTKRHCGASHRFQ